MSIKYNIIMHEKGVFSMSNELSEKKIYQREGEVLYKSEINKVAFKNFTEADYNLFFVIVSRCVEDMQKGKSGQLGRNGTIKLDFSTIKKIAGLKNTHISNQVFWDKYLNQMSDKLGDCKCVLENSSKIVKFTLFPTWEFDKDNATLEISINDKFKYLLNDFDRDKGGFTPLELKKFVDLKSKFTKTLYRNLRQFRTQGIYVVTADDFRLLYDVPRSYKHSDIMKRIINPSIEELTKGKTPAFKGLKCEPKKAPKQGAPVKAYEFTFQKQIPKRQEQTEGQSGFEQATEVMQKYKKQKEKSKNRFNNFEQNTIDFEELEEKLLDN